MKIKLLLAVATIALTCGFVYEKHVPQVEIIHHYKFTQEEVMKLLLAEVKRTQKDAYYDDKSGMVLFPETSSEYRFNAKRGGDMVILRYIERREVDQ